MTISLNILKIFENVNEKLDILYQKVDWKKKKHLQLLSQSHIVRYTS